MGEDPAAKALREAIAEQNRIDKERLDKVNAEAQAELDRKQNERDRQAAAEALKRAAGEA